MPYRKPKEDQIDYVLKGIPRDLWERAKAKAEAHQPPISMRWLLIQLVERYAPPPGPKKLTAPKVKRTKVEKIPIPKTLPPIPSMIGVPDLGDSF